MQEELQNPRLKIAEMEKAQAEQAKAQAKQAKAQAKQAKEFEDLKNELVKYLPNLSEESDPVTEDDN
ncbi:unnamed protein product [Arabis nemorensis]|uniref:Uncharacterized protein n=1 Tax=Arabis nemorensis TaxID=586526 RepID=A0A565BB36_9BRAS|nr:unnamed protein product [Arabis nemorensis]